MAARVGRPGRRSSSPGPARSALRRPGRRGPRRRCRRWRRPHAGDRSHPAAIAVPRRSTDTLRHTRTEPSGSVTARLRTSPNGAAISELCWVCRPEHRAVEQRGLVEPVERLGQGDVVDVADPGPAHGPRSSAPAAVRSPTASWCRHRRRSGRRTPRCRRVRRRPTRSASAGPAPAGQHRCQQRLRAGGGVRRIRGFQRPARQRRPRWDARPGRWRSSAAPGHRPATRAAPAWSGAARCGRNPVRASVLSTAGLLSSSTASSAKANPPSDGSGGATATPRRRSRRSPPAVRAGSDPTVDSCSASSERCASTADRAGSDCRKTSLNTSSDSGPV